MKSSGIKFNSLWFCSLCNWIMFQWYNIAVGACNRVSPIEPATVTGLRISHTLRCMRKNLQEKEESHVVLSPFEYRTVVIFQVLILTLNAFETSCGINLWKWIGESVSQTMQCQLSDQQGYAFFFYATHDDDTLRCLHLQFLVVTQAMSIKFDPAWKRQDDSR